MSSERLQQLDEQRELLARALGPVLGIHAQHLMEDEGAIEGLCVVVFSLVFPSRL